MAIKWQLFGQIVCVFFFVNFSNTLIAQQQDSSKAKVTFDSVSYLKSKWWLTLGYGASNISESNDFSACVGGIMTIESGYNFFSARVVHDQTARDDVFPKQSVFDASILYGVGFHRELWFGNASIGLAYTATTKRIFDHIDSTTSLNLEVDRPELFRGIGFAWQLQLFSKFSDSSYAGIGITVCGNINKSFPFWMILLSLEFGEFGNF